VVEYREAEYTCTDRRCGVETTDYKVTFGLDMAEKHRILDQRIALETNC